jgi:hypothetical protein
MKCIKTDPLIDYTGLHNSCSPEREAMATRYWITSLTVQGGTAAGSLWSRLEDSISRHSFDTPLYRVSLLLPLLLSIPPAAMFSSDNILALRSSTFQISAWAPSIRSSPSATISSRFTVLLPRFRSRSLPPSVCCDVVAVCAVQHLRGGRLAQDPEADRGSRTRWRGRDWRTHRRWRTRRHLPHQVLLSSLTSYAAGSAAPMLNSLLSVLNQL